MIRYDPWPNPQDQQMPRASCQSPLNLSTASLLRIPQSACTSPQVRSAKTRGFSLLELLLVLVILLLVSGALVLSYTAMAGGSELREGAAQFATAMRYARAEAINSGRSVRIYFLPHAQASDIGGLRYEVEVRWERDPLREPGLFVPMEHPAWVQQMPHDLVAVEDVRLRGPDADAVRVFLTGEAKAAASPQAAYLPELTFYPDGTSDTMEVILGSIDRNSLGRAVVQIDGLAGVIRHHLVDSVELADEVVEEPENGGLPAQP